MSSTAVYTTHDVISESSESWSQCLATRSTSWFMSIQSKKGMSATKQEFSFSPRSGYFSDTEIVDDAKLNEDSPYSRLHIAACLGQNGLANALLETHEVMLNIDQPDHNGNTALMWASSEGNEEMIQLLIDCGAKVNLQNFGGETALYLAAARGFDQLCMILLEHGANINLSTLDESTPCHIAAVEGHVNVLMNLVMNGVHVNAQDEEGDTPLHYAVRGGNIKALEFLVTQCNAFIDVRNADKETPLDLAVALGEVEMIEFLSKYGKVGTLDAECEETFMMF